MALSSPGIGSNLDINSIVSQLMQVESQPLMALARKQASHQAKLSAIGNLKGALSTFQTAVSGLSDTSKFNTIKTGIADSSIATVSGTSTAIPGTYGLEVTQLAQAQKLVAAGQASVSTAIGSGTITIDFGTISGGTFDATTGKYTGAAFASNGSGAKTITIDSSNNSLSGIRDAINKADIGITASIVNDGGATPYRLVLTETRTGASNSMRISVAGDAALQSLLAHDPANDAGQALSESVTARNAEFEVDGIAISKSSNTVTDAIPGVTLTLTKTNSGSPTNVSVSRDSTAVTGAVGQFVFAFNQINQTLTELSSYNSTTKQAGILNGDATVRSIQSQIRGLLSAPVAGGVSTYTVLSQIGVTIQKDGKLAVDNTKLQKAVDSNSGDIASLFAATGKASDSLATYLGGSNKTVAGSYDLNVSQLATQGSLTAEIAAALTVDASNDTLDIKLNGVTATIKLEQKTYATAAELAAEVQSKINGATDFSDAAMAVKVTESAGVLTIESSRYGSDSTVEVTGGTGKATLIGTNPTATAGLNIVGTINGAVATGAGQVLTGASGTDVDGLRIEVTGGALGSRGTVNFSRGYASQLDALVTAMLDSEGAIAARTDGLNATLKTLETQKEQISKRLVDVEKRYRAQFTALDQVIASMTKTSSFLTQQLANLPKIE